MKGREEEGARNNIIIDDITYEEREILQHEKNSRGQDDLDRQAVTEGCYMPKTAET